MNKKASNTALVVAGIAIVLLVAIIFYEIFRTKPVAEESQMPNLITDPNAGLENMLNDIYDMGLSRSQRNPSKRKSQLPPKRLLAKKILPYKKQKINMEKRKVLTLV